MRKTVVALALSKSNADAVEKTVGVFTASANGERAVFSQNAVRINCRQLVNGFGLFVNDIHFKLKKLRKTFFRAKALNQQKIFAERRA